jgi:hypothetical protein
MTGRRLSGKAGSAHARADPDQQRRLRPIRDCARKGWPLAGQLWLRTRDTSLAFQVQPGAASPPERSLLRFRR